MKEIIDKVILDKIKTGRNGVNDSFLDHSYRLAEDMGLSSLDVMEIIMECEIKLNTRIPDSEIHDITTKKDIYNLFEKYAN